MSLVQQITVSSQVKSANAVTDVDNHSGKENREKYAHENPDIDKTKSKYNVELDFYDRLELLEEHYEETIQKHNENKNNKTEEKKWTLEKYLETFESKTVMRGGKETKNARSATASQISYFGGKDSLNPVLKALVKAGASQEDVRNAYASGYNEYVQQHNEKFYTLPIYHSDIHFDETTPHGHDAMVVKGHTEKGRASDSINNALGELYGYAPDMPDGKGGTKKKDGFKHNQKNMARYREENDHIMFDAIGSKLEALGEAHGLNFKFEFLRTGETSSFGYREYKQRQAFENQAEGLSEKEGKLTEKEAELDEKEEELEGVQEFQENRSKAQKDAVAKNRERSRELDKREEAINSQGSVLTLRERSVEEKERELEEKANALAASQLALAKKMERIANLESAVVDVSSAILSYSNASFDKQMSASMKSNGLADVNVGTVIKAFPFSIADALKNKQGEEMKEEVEQITDIHKNRASKIHVQQVIEDDGPEL